MDEYDVKQMLKHFYKIENRSVKLTSEESYIKIHIELIIKQGGGTWKADIAQEYIDNLEKSI